jgi:hypothetical protein
LRLVVNRRGNSTSELFNSLCPKSSLRVSLNQLYSYADSHWLYVPCSQHTFFLPLPHTYALSHSSPPPPSVNLCSGNYNVLEGHEILDGTGSYVCNF